MLTVVPENGAVVKNRLSRRAGVLGSTSDGAGGGPPKETTSCGRCATVEDSLLENATASTGGFASVNEYSPLPVTTDVTSSSTQDPSGAGFDAATGPPVVAGAVLHDVVVSLHVASAVR